MRKKGPNTKRTSPYNVKVSPGKFDRVINSKDADIRLVYLFRNPGVVLDGIASYLGAKYEYQFGVTFKLVVYHNGFLYFKDVERRAGEEDEVVVIRQRAKGQKKGISIKDMMGGMGTDIECNGTFLAHYSFQTSINNKFKEWPL